MGGDYIFLSYSHKDTERIQSMIDWLEEDYHVWYDKNLGAAREYNEEIADQIRNSRIVIAFFSTAYMDSPYCRDEIMYARTKGVEILGILIEEVRMSEGMQLRLGRFQLLNFIHKAEYEKIISNQLVMNCQKDKKGNSLLGNLKRESGEQKMQQLPRMLFATDFNGANVFSACGEWKRTESGTLRVPIGLRQDIERGDVSEANYDTAYGHQCICGSTMSGKSTMFQTILLQMMERYSPEAVQFYMIDFGNYMLDLFRYAPHVGDVMNNEDPEKMKRFFVFIEKELKERIRFFRNGSFDAYTQKYGMEKPIILIAIDGYENFYNEILQNEAHEKIFKQILREGRRCGILLLVEKGSLRTMGLASSMEGISTLAALGYETVDDYDRVFGGYGYFSDQVKNRIQQENFELPGKGLLKNGKKIYLIQSALPIAVAEDYDRYDALIEKCKEMQNQWKGARALGVPEIPENFSMEYFENLPEVKMIKEKSQEMPLGLSVYSVQPRTISLIRNAILPIVGDGGSGKSNLLRIILKELKARNWETVLIDPKNEHINETKEGKIKYASSVEDLYGICKELIDILKIRKESQEVLEPMFILVDEVKFFYQWLNSKSAKEKNIDTFMYNLMEKGRKYNIYFVVTTGLKRAYGEFIEPVTGMNALIQNGHEQGIFLGKNISDESFWLNKGQGFPISILRKVGTPYGMGVGILVENSDLISENIIKIPIVKPT